MEGVNTDAENFYEFYLAPFAAEFAPASVLEILVHNVSRFISGVIHYNESSVFEALNSFVKFFHVDAEVCQYHQFSAISLLTLIRPFYSRSLLSIVTFANNRTAFRLTKYHKSSSSL